MSMREVWAFIKHRIRQVPGSGPVYLSFCTKADCMEDSEPSSDQEKVQLWCLRHAGKTGHDLYLRTVTTDYAKVDRLE